MTLNREKKKKFLNVKTRAINDRNNDYYILRNMHRIKRQRNDHHSKSLRKF